VTFRLRFPSISQTRVGKVIADPDIHADILSMQREDFRTPYTKCICTNSAIVNLGICVAAAVFVTTNTVRV
jgi:hypothetical protein